MRRRNRPCQDVHLSIYGADGYKKKDGYPPWSSTLFSRRKNLLSTCHSTMAISAPHDGDVHITDIRRNDIPVSILDEMDSKLRPPPGQEKSMPTMLLYDETGLRLFEDITYLEEYYLTNAEIEVLERYADNIAERIHRGSRLVELGSGYAWSNTNQLQHLTDTGSWLRGVTDQPSGISAKSEFS